MIRLSGQDLQSESSSYGNFGSKPANFSTLIGPFDGIIQDVEKLRYSATAHLRREKLRRRYLPAHLRLLFIGEAPPASGRFFYQSDSGLYRAIRDAFRAIDPSITDPGFLPLFQASGCYLIDLCSQPVDRLDSLARRVACIAAEALLSRTIGKLQPRAIVTVVRSVRRNVERAAFCAGWDGPLIDLPYPGRWFRHQEAFVAKLEPVLRDALGDLTARGGPNSGVRRMSNETRMVHHDLHHDAG